MVQSERPARPDNASPVWKALLPIGLALALIGGYSLVRQWTNDGGWRKDPDAAPRPVTARGDLAADEQATTQLFKTVKDGVVNVDTLLYQRDRLSANILERQQGTGSGFIWDKNGHVVTNYHVVAEAAQRESLRLRVNLADRTPYTARYVGGAPEYDLAVLQISAPADKLRAIAVGTSHNLEVGQNVFAIGNPFGLSLSLTRGIISALDREIQSQAGRTITGVVQTDAAINPGNSGGPLLDSAGLLIGVNTAIASPSGANAGIGFAIPVDTVNEVVPQLIRTGKVARPTLGVRLLDAARVPRLSVESGVLVAQVVPGGPAAAAGLRDAQVDEEGNIVCDVIVGLNGQPVGNTRDLIRLLGQCKIGQEVRLRVRRDGQEQEVSATLQGG